MSSIPKKQLQSGFVSVKETFKSGLDFIMHSQVFSATNLMFIFEMLSQSISFAYTVHFVFLLNVNWCFM